MVGCGLMGLEIAEVSARAASTSWSSRVPQSSGRAVFRLGKSLKRAERGSRTPVCGTPRPRHANAGREARSRCAHAARCLAGASYPVSRQLSPEGATMSKERLLCLTTQASAGSTHTLPVV